VLLKIIRLFKTASSIFTLLLICISVCSSAQPSYVLHKPYGVQFLAVDSIYYQLKSQDSITIIKEINRLENWSREQNDIPLSYAFHLLTFRYSSIRCKKNNTEVETLLPLFIIELNNHKLPLLRAEAMAVFADYCWNSYKTAGLAFEYSLNAYSIYNTVTATDFPTKSFDLYNLGINFSRFKDYRGAIKYLNEAAATKPIYREIRVFNIYNALGLSYRNAEIYDSAEFCFKKAYSIIDTSKNIVWAGIINGNLGITYYYEKRYTEAIPLLEKDISICIQRKQVKNAAKSLAILGDIYLINGDKQKAQTLLKQSYQLIQDGGKWEDYELLQSVYPILAKVSAANGQTAAAYAFLDSTMKVKDSIASLKNVLILARTQQKIQEEKYALEVQKVEDAKEINIIIRNSLVIGIVLFTLISGRNPELLIGQHVVSAPMVKASGLEVISTGYIVVDGGAPTTVSYMSNAAPIPANKSDIALCTAWAGELQGKHVIYMDAGSGARNPVSEEMIQKVSSHIDIPLIVGGGILNPEKVYANCKAGANIVVVGNAIERDPLLIKDMAQATKEAMKSIH